MASTVDLRQCPPLILISEQIKRKELTILDFLDRLPWFRGGADWSAWRAFLCATYGLPMSQQEYDIFTACTGRKDAPTTKAREVWVPVGRRGRKTALAALIGAWEGIQDWTHGLAPGERAAIPMISKNREDAVTLRSFVAAIFTTSHALKPFLEEEPNTQEIKLVTRVDMLIKAIGMTAGRSRAVPLALLDEQAFWPKDGSALPDTEVVNGIRGAQATFQNPMIMVMSSPYAKRGMLWQAFKDHWGVEGDSTLVWKAPTLRMHNTPTVVAHVEEQYRADAVSANAEYGAEFRDDVTVFITEELVDAAIIPGRGRLEPVAHTRYFAFADTSGGTSDSMTLAIAHWSAVSRKAVVDLVDEIPAPYDPEKAVERHASILKGYGLTKVTGDRYGSEWVPSRYRANGIRYTPCKLVKNDLYLAFLPMLTSREAELPDNARMRAQLVSLDRITGRGKDVVDHPPGSHDDVANVIAGACVMASGRILDDVGEEQPEKVLTPQEGRKKLLADAQSQIYNPAPAVSSPYRRRR